MHFERQRLPRNLARKYPTRYLRAASEPAQKKGKTCKQSLDSSGAQPASKARQLSTHDQQSLSQAAESARRLEKFHHHTLANEGIHTEYVHR